MENLKVQRKKMSLANIENRLTPEEMENVMAGSCNGADINGCIMAAYTNNGWTSVALFITSAAIWQTTAAVALACAAKNGC